MRSKDFEASSQLIHLPAARHPSSPKGVLATVAQNGQLNQALGSLITFAQSWELSQYSIRFGIRWLQNSSCSRYRDTSRIVIMKGEKVRQQIEMAQTLPAKEKISLNRLSATFK